MAINKAFRVIGTAATQNVIKGVDGLATSIRRAKGETDNLNHAAERARIAEEKLAKAEANEVASAMARVVAVTKNLNAERARAVKEADQARVAAEKLAKAEANEVAAAMSRVVIVTKARAQAQAQADRAFKHSVQEQKRLTDELVRARKKVDDADGGGLLGGLDGDKLRTAGMYVAAVGAAAYAVDRLVDRSIALNNVQKNLNYSIEDAQRAALGMVDSFELSRLAVTAQTMGVAQTKKEFDELVESTTKIALLMGRDVPDSVRRAVEGIGKMEPEVLDELGIGGIKAADAFKKFAEQHDRTVSSLTAAERQMAYNEYAVGKIKEKAKSAEVEVSGFARAWIDLRIAMVDYANAWVSGPEQIFDQWAKGHKKLADASRMRGTLDEWNKKNGPQVPLSNGDFASLIPDDVKDSLREFARARQEIVDKETQSNLLDDIKLKLLEDQGKELDEQAQLRLRLLVAEQNGIETEELKKHREEERTKAIEAAAKARALSLAKLDAQESEADRARERMELDGISRFEVIAAQESDKIRFIEERLRLTNEERERIALRNEAAQAAWEAEKARREELKRQDQEAVEIAKAVVEENKRQIEDKLALQQWGIERELEQRLVGMEEAAALGLLDPMQRAEQEFIAQQTALEQKLELHLQEQVAESEKTQHLIEEERLRQQIQSNSTKHHAAQIAARRKQDEDWRKANIQVTGAVADTVGTMTSQIAGHLAANGEAYGLSEKQLRSAKAMELGILALVEGANAAAAFAGQNYAKGAMHVVAAGVATANAIIVGQGAGGSSVPVKGGISEGALGGGARGGSQRSGTSNRSAELSEGPLSRAGVSGAVQAQAPTTGNRNGGGHTVIINSQSLEGPDAEKMLRKVRKGLNDLDRNYGAA